MPQLILDEAAMHLAMERLRGQPLFTEANGELQAPGLVELDDSPGARWQPNDPRARGLVFAAETCQDVVFQATRFSEPGQRRRTLVAMTAPLCSLMEEVVKLLKEFNTDEWQKARENWPSADRKTYKTYSRTLKKKRLRGPVRKARNKRGAHMDPSLLRDGLRLTIDDVLMAMGDSLVLLMLCMNHPGAFSWIRGLGVTSDGQHRVVETMYTYPLCVRWLTDLDGHVKDVCPGLLSKDPRGEVQPHILDGVQTYNNMIHLSGSALSTIFTMPTDELRAREDAHGLWFSSTREARE